MMTGGGEGGKKCRKFDDVICERPLKCSPVSPNGTLRRYNYKYIYVCDCVGEESCPNFEPCAHR